MSLLNFSHNTKAVSHYKTFKPYLAVIWEPMSSGSTYLKKIHLGVEFKFVFYQELKKWIIIFDVV